MGKAFVAKLAKEGARDPEALAAWIGRKKHGAAAFKKLAAAGQKKREQQAPSASRASKRATQRAATPQAPRDMQRGFRAEDAQKPLEQRRFAVSDQELNALRLDVTLDQKTIERQEARGDRTGAGITRTAMEARQAQIADAEHARDTVAGERAYAQAAAPKREAANAAVRKARSTDDPGDWAAAAQAAEAFSREAGQSPYGKKDSGWYRGEAEAARKEATASQERRRREAERKQAQTLPPPKPGETPVAHAAHLDSEGRTQAFGDPTMGRKVISQSPGVTAMPDTGAEGHDSVLANVSPAFRKKVMAARASGRPWLHNITHDSGGAEIHKLQVVGADNKVQNTTFLERNSKKWKAKEEQRQASS